MNKALILVAVLAATACAADDPPPAEAGSAASEAAVAGAEATGQVAVAERNVVYVDVRRPDEWEEARVPGAIHIPHTEMAARWHELEAYRDDEIVLYCRTGRRSGIAEEILAEKGFQNLRNGGGLSDLERQGVAVERCGQLAAC